MVPTSVTVLIAGFFGLVPLYFGRFYLLLFSDSVQTRHLVEAVSFTVLTGLLLTYGRPHDSDVNKDVIDPRVDDLGRDKEMAGRLVLIDCILWFAGVPFTVSSHPAVIALCLGGIAAAVSSGPGWLNLPGWKGTRYPVRESFKQE